MVIDTPEKPEKPVYKAGWAKPKKKVSPHAPSKGPAKGAAKPKRPAKSIESKFIDIGKPAARGKPADGAARRVSEKPGRAAPRPAGKPSRGSSGPSRGPAPRGGPGKR